MSRKVLAVMVIGILVLGAVFASGTSKSAIEVQGSPYSFQKIRYKNTIEYESETGWGGKVGYLYYCYPNLYVGADLTYSNFRYAQKQNRYIVVGLMAKGGVLMDMSDSFKIDLALKAGADLRKWGSNTKFYPSFAAYAGAVYRLNEVIDITAGADLKLASQMNKNPVYSSVDTSVHCCFGARIGL